MMEKMVVWTFRDLEHFGNSMPVQAVLEAKAAKKD